MDTKQNASCLFVLAICVLLMIGLWAPFFGDWFRQDKHWLLVNFLLLVRWVAAGTLMVFLFWLCVYNNRKPPKV